MSRDKITFHWFEMRKVGGIKRKQATIPNDVLLDFIVNKTRFELLERIGRNTMRSIRK